MVVESDHELLRVKIVYRPKARDYTLRPGFERGVGDTQEFIPVPAAKQTGAAAREYDNSRCPRESGQRLKVDPLHISIAVGEKKAGSSAEPGIATPVNRQVNDIRSPGAQGLLDRVSGTCRSEEGFCPECRRHVFTFFGRAA
jgi:hypothetical protein